MSFDTKGPTHATAHASASSASREPDARPRTPAEHAADLIARLARDADSVGAQVAKLKRARDANSLAEWTHAHEALTADIAAAREGLAAARHSAKDAAPDAQAKLKAVDAQLGTYFAEAETLDEPPRGWSPISREADILAVLDTPADSKQAEFDTKQQRLEALFKQLPAADAKQLRLRITRPAATDPIATALGRFIASRRERLVAVLEGAPQREAMRRSVAARTAPATATTTEHAGPASAPTVETHGAALATAPTSAAPTHAGAQPAHAPAPTAPTSHAVAARDPASPNAELEHADARTETLDAQFERMIDAREPDIDALARMRADDRDALALRLRRYRMGTSGDRVGYRFSQLPSATRDRFFKALANPVHEPPTVTPVTPVAFVADPKVAASTTPVGPQQQLAAAVPTPPLQAAPPAPTHTDFDDYLAHFWNHFQNVISEQLGATSWPDLGSGLALVPRHFIGWIALNVINPIRDRGGEARFVELLRPSNVRELFERTVEVREDPETHKRTAPWSPAFGYMVAGLVEYAALTSLKRRVAPQYVLAAARHAELPTMRDLNLSGEYPMDAVVAAALTARGAVVRTGEPIVAPLAAAAPPPVVLSQAQLTDIDDQIGLTLTKIGAFANVANVPAPLSRVTAERARRAAVIANGDEAARAPLGPELELQYAQLLTIMEHLLPLVKALPAGPPAPKDAPLRATFARYLEAADVSYELEASVAITNSIAMDAIIENDAIVSANVEGATAQDIAATGDAASGWQGAKAAADMQRQADLSGDAADRNPYKRTETDIVAGEVALRSQLDAVSRWVSELEVAARAAGYDDPELFASAVPDAAMSVPELIGALVSGVAGVKNLLKDGAAEPAVQDDPNAPDDWADWKMRAETLAAAQQAFAKLGADRQISAVLNDIAKKIHHKQMVNAVIHIAEALVITVASGFAASELGLAIAGGVLGTTEGLAAGLIVGTTEVVINTAVQMLLSNGEGGTAAAGWNLLENTLMTIFTRGLMTPFSHAQAAAIKEVQALKALPNLDEDALKALSAIRYTGAELVMTMVTNTMAQWGAHRLAMLGQSGAEVNSDLALTVVQQGAAIGLGRFFAGRLNAWKAHQQALERSRLGKLPEAKALFDARAAFYAKAQALEVNPSPDPSEGPALQAEDLALIKQERELFEQHGVDPNAPPRGEHAPPHDEHAAQRGRVEHVPPHDHAAQPAHVEHAPSHDEHAPSHDEHAAQPAHVEHAPSHGEHAAPKPASMPTSADEASARKANGERWSNKQVRDYYKTKNAEIPALNKQWKQQGLSAEDRARKAYDIRHGMRMVAREMMGVPADQLRVLVGDAQKYGDGEGPTFEELVAQQRAQGLQGDAVYESIISGAERTDKATNERVKNDRTDAQPQPQLDLPSGAVVHGDRVTVQGTNGRSYNIRIKQGSSGRTETVRNSDGSFTIMIGEGVPAEVASRQVARALAEFAETPRQNTDNLDELYKDAAVAQRELGELTRSVASDLGGRAMVPEQLKGRARAQEKIQADYQGENARLTDLARSTIEFDTPQQIEKALKELAARAEIVRIKDRFKAPVDGYRDVMLNLRTSNGQICEMQLHLKAILDVKNGPGHPLYEQIRAIDALAKTEHRPLTSAEQERRDALVAQMKALYDNAYETSEHQGESNAR